MKNVLFTLVFLLLAGVGVALITGEMSRGEADVATSGPSPLDADYDYYIQDMRATRFGSDGQPVSQLTAARVTHYPDGDRAELQAPAFKAFGGENDAWQASAATGTLAPDAERAEERLDLQGDVALYKPQALGDFWDVQTSALAVYLTTEEAATTAPVALQTRNTRVDGVGMRALLAENTIQLNDGKSTHDPAQRP